MNKEKCKLAYGDRIYARLCQNGRQIVEFVVERVSDMTEVIGEVRHYTRKYRGLCKLYIRNMSRGWSMERPLMLYPDSYHTPSGWRERSADIPSTQPRAVQGMLFPWETH